MSTTLLFSLMVMVLGIYCVVYCAGSKSNNHVASVIATEKSSQQMIQQAFKNFMNMKNVPNLTTGDSGSTGRRRPKMRNGGRRRQRQPPKYMVDLYKKYRDNVASGSKQTTVTSIQPIKGLNISISSFKDIAYPNIK